jgi:hypothetical protein
MTPPLSPAPITVETLQRICRMLGYDPETVEAVKVTPDMVTVRLTGRKAYHQVDRRQHPAPPRYETIPLFNP